MKRLILPIALPIALLVAGCGGSGVSTSRGPNGETIAGNNVSVQVSGAATPTVAFELAQRYCTRYDRAARFVGQNGDAAAFDCVKRS